ncbi:MAG: phosphate ABC transporter permease subunit PstC [Prevotella sp.]
MKDKLAGYLMAALAVGAMLLVIALGVGLYLKSAPILHAHSLWSLLTSTTWKPQQGEFGFLPFLAGTGAVTFLAVVLALPLSLLLAIYLSEYANKRVRRLSNSLLDILAGLPSVIYGVWGTLLIIPWISRWLAPTLGLSSSGYTVLAGGIVLGVMVIPLMTSLFTELFANVPVSMRESSLALGSTAWQTIKFVVLRKSLPGIIATIVLAVSRALGETIAVMMVCGNLPIIPKSLLDACYPLPALIANNYGEMLSVPMYESALMLAALILFVLVVAFNLGARVVLRRF